MRNKFDIGSFVSVLTEQTVTKNLTERFIKRRKELKITQRELAEKSGVSYASIRRFESTGEISLSSLVSLANAIGLLADFNLLFSSSLVKNLKDYE